MTFQLTVDFSMLSLGKECSTQSKRLMHNLACATVRAAFRHASTSLNHCVARMKTIRKKYNNAGARMVPPDSFCIRLPKCSMPQHASCKYPFGLFGKELEIQCTLATFLCDSSTSQALHQHSNFRECYNFSRLGCRMQNSPSGR